MYLLYAVIGNSGRCLFYFYDLFGKQAKIYSDGCESIQDRTGDVFSCFRCDFEEYQVALRPEEHFFIVTRASRQSYLSLRDCVCLRGCLESDTVSMDWVKASLLKALLRRVSSLEV